MSDHMQAVREKMGKRLMQLRRDANLQQQDVADSLTGHGYSYTYNAISNWERGTNSIPLADPDFVRALAESLFITPKLLLLSLGYFEDEEPGITYQERKIIMLLRDGKFGEVLFVLGLLIDADRE